jgi:hypothetical protein
MHTKRLIAAVSVLVLTASVACSSDDSGDESDASETTATVELEGVVELDSAVIDEAEAGCDPLDEHSCYLPFPSDAYTTPSDETDTGLLVDLRIDNMPVNATGVAIDPTELDRNDGFSPGTPIMTSANGVDLDASGAPPITDIGRSLEDDSPIVLVDADTGDRHPFWAEVDGQAPSPEETLLILRPAVNLTEGHRYVVAMRNLVDANGTALEPSGAFVAYRDRFDTSNEAVEARRPAMEADFSLLEDAGVERENLYLAWDFTVASERNLSERLLHIRDDAFEQLGDEAPTFEVTETTDEAIQGTFEVPLYLTGTGEAGERFNDGDDGLPEQNGTYTASFLCTVPASARTDGEALPVVYGHGLLGSRDEVDAGNIVDMTNEHNMVYCATDWIGMAESDVGNAIAILGDLGQFHTLADRVQQGILNTLFLARLMKHEDGLVSNPAFRTADGEPMLDTEEVFYDSNSQGAIIGGAATAVAQDWTRAVLGVPGMNYSTLLQRSVDFDTYARVLEPAYPSEVDRLLGMAMIQMLWDRAETNGYAAHATDDPYPDTPEHQILLQVAFGDWQVADITASVEARTMGARYHDPALGDDRAVLDYFFDLSPIDDYPYGGSALVFWDSGVPSASEDNTPPRGEGDPIEPHDPHSDPRSTPAAREQKAAFLAHGGKVIDVCDGAPCESVRD